MNLALREAFTEGRLPVLQKYNIIFVFLLAGWTDWGEACRSALSVPLGA
jgi:hypothetical protein